MSVVGQNTENQETEGPDQESDDKRQGLISGDTPSPGNTRKSGKALKIGGALLLGGVILVWWSGDGTVVDTTDKQEQIEATDKVKPELEVGDVETYDNSYIQDAADQIDDDSEALLNNLDAEPDQLVRTPGRLPDWVGSDAPEPVAVPSTGRVHIVGGGVYQDNEKRPDASSEEIDINASPSTPEEENQESGSGLIGKAKNKLKGVTGNGMISNIVIDQAGGMLGGN